MALRPIQFDVPRREPSIIEDAFRLAIRELISVPFEKAREKRAEAGLLRREEALARLQSRLRMGEAIRRGELVELTPERESVLQTAGRSDVIGGAISGVEEFTGKKFVPSKEFASATAATQPISQEEQSAIDRILGVTRIKTPARRGAPILAVGEGGITELGETAPLPLTRQKAAELEGVIPEAISAGQLEIARTRATQEAEATRELRAAGLVADPDKIPGRAVWEVHPKTGERYLRALTPREAVALDPQNAVRLEFMSKSTDPGVRGLATELIELRNKVERDGGVQRLAGISLKDLTLHVSAMRGLPSHEAQRALSPFIDVADRVGALVDQEKRRLTEPGERAAKLVETPGLLEGLYIAQSYGSEQRYQEAVRSGYEALPEGMLEVARQAWRLKKPGDTTGGVRTGVPAGLQITLGAEARGGTLRAAPPVHAGPRPTAGFGSLYSIYYNNLLDGVQQYENTYTDVLRAHQDLDAAIKYYRARIDLLRANGKEALAQRLEQAVNQDLESGTPQQRQVALTRLRVQALGALQSARDAILAPPQ